MTEQPRDVLVKMGEFMRSQSQVAPELETLVNRLTAQLGESPEAWRGAVLTAEWLMRTHMHTNPDSPLDCQAAMHAEALLLGAFITQPFAVDTVRRIDIERKAAKEAQS